MYYGSGIVARSRITSVQPADAAAYVACNSGRRADAAWALIRWQ